MTRDEIEVGAFYTQSAYRYSAARKVIAIEDSVVTYAWAGPHPMKTVSIRAFAAWANHRRGAGEAIIPNRIIFAAETPRGDAIEIWPVLKDGHVLFYNYALHPHAIFAESPPASPGDLNHQIDVRDLPARFRSGLDIEMADLDLSPIEAWFRGRAAHIAAFARAIAGGENLRRSTIAQQHQETQP